MKRQVKTYTFAPGGAGAGQITFTNYSSISLDSIYAIHNDTRSVFIYNPFDTSTNKRGSVAGNVLTLNFDTTGHSSGDALTIIYDDVDLDFDTGAGTVIRPPAYLAAAASGGPVAIPGDATNGLWVNVKTSATLTVTVSGTVTVTQTPATSGGLTISRTLSASGTNATLVKNAAGQVYGWYITNTNAAARFVKLYNSSSAPTAGSGTPVMTLLVPGGTSGSGVIAAEYTSGIAFSSGIGFTITSGVADSDTGSVNANEVILHLFYK